MTITTTPHLEDDAAAVLAAIRADAAEGVFGGDRIGAFADLHDYVDANDYAACIDMARAGRAMHAELAGSTPLGELWRDYVNAVFVAVDGELHRHPVQ